MSLVEKGLVRQRRLISRVSTAVAAVALSAVMTAPAQAQDVFQVVTSRSTFVPGDDELGAATLVITKGSTLTLTNADTFAAHGLTSDAIVPETGRRLFESGVLNFRASALVQGAQSLPAGSYPFHCSVHEDNMHGTLVVH